VTHPEKVTGQQFRLTRFPTIILYPCIRLEIRQLPTLSGLLQLPLKLSHASGTARKLTCPFAVAEMVLETLRAHPSAYIKLLAYYVLTNPAALVVGGIRTCPWAVPSSTLARHMRELWKKLKSPQTDLLSCYGQSGSYEPIGHSYKPSEHFAVETIRDPIHCPPYPEVPERTATE
jgi:hypothetical protein